MTKGKVPIRKKRRQKTTGETMQDSQDFYKQIVIALRRDIGAISKVASEAYMSSLRSELNCHEGGFKGVHDALIMIDINLKSISKALGLVFGEPVVFQPRHSTTEDC